MRISDWSSDVCSSDLLIAEIVHQAGVPAGIINLVFGSGTETGAQLTAHPLIDRVSFIGSHAAAGCVSREVSGEIKPLSLTLRRMSVEVMIVDDVSDPDITRKEPAAMQEIASAKR